MFGRALLYLARLPLSVFRKSQIPVCANLSVNPQPPRCRSLARATLAFRRSRRAAESMPDVGRSSLGRSGLPSRKYRRRETRDGVNARSLNRVSLRNARRERKRDLVPRECSCLECTSLVHSLGDFSRKQQFNGEGNALRNARRFSSCAREPSELRCEASLQIFTEKNNLLP